MYWLGKSDPEEYSFENLLKDGKASWDGIRNYAARNHMKAMKKGDKVLVYHSGGISAVVGTATVTKAFYRDPTADDDTWVSVELKAGRALEKPVTLAEIKKDKRLKDMILLKISRLSVMPMTKEEFTIISA